MADLEQAMRTRIDAVTPTDPAARAIERLRETGRAYVDFALREPGLFAVAFSTAGGPEAHREADTMVGPYAVLNAVLDELVECGAVTPARRQGADVACWAMVHGFASSTWTDPSARSRGDPRRAARDGARRRAPRHRRLSQSAATTAAQPCGTAPRPVPSSGFQYSANPDASTPAYDISRILSYVAWSPQR